MGRLFGLPDLEHLGPAGGTGSGCGRLLVLHRNSLGSLHFLLCFALNTITFQI